jgi:serine/threonine protein kinase/tetratricopeptide (TPR) repeat protein
VEIRRQRNGGSAAGALSALLQELASTAAPGEAWERELSPGEVIGRFELVRELGRGGFSVVYEARDRELGRSVAFKAVRPGRAEPGGDQLQREAEAIARLAHPNLVTLYDVGRCEQGPYLVLELLRGSTLERRLELGPLPLAEALRVGAEVARGLAHAHAGGVVHRDLKPSNVFLCDRGPVKVLDFGMAHAFGRQRVSGGTPAYMAPEQWRGAPEDERTDVFALGVMLYQMLSGELPFGSGGKALEGPAGAPDLVLPEAPGLAELVGRMLAKDPVERPRHAGEVLEVLAALQQESGRTTSTARTGPVQTRRRPGGRPLVQLAALALSAAVLGGAVAALVVRRPETPAPIPAGTPSVAVLPFASLSSSPEDAFFADGVHSELITQLTKVSGVRVIARGSVERYRGGSRDLREVAAALGVRTVLEGTVQRSGGRARIAVQLVDAFDGHELWAERFDREVADVFAIQTEVALEISRMLGATLSASERRLVERKPTPDQDAHDAYLRGRHYWERSVGVESDNRMAEELLTAAIRRDASFARAHALLAVVLAEARGECDGAREHAARAQALEPDLPDAHAALGQLHYFCDRDVPSAIAETEAAIMGAPGDATARLFLGQMRTMLGRMDEGIADLDAALAIDPRSYLVAIEVAGELARVRRFAEAARACDRARQIEPGDVHGLALCALIPVWRGGDLGPASHVLDVLPAELPTGGDGAWSLLQLLALFPERALALAESGRLGEPFSQSPLIPRGWVVGCAQAALGREGAARLAFAPTLPQLEARAQAAPRDVLARFFLARAYAGVGQVREALREARRAADQARDAGREASGQRLLAEVAAAAGAKDEAVAALAQALVRPDGLVTPASVQVDPRFAALRGMPSFRDLSAAPPARAATGRP